MNRFIKSTLALLTASLMLLCSCTNSTKTDTPSTVSGTESQSEKPKSHSVSLPFSAKDKLNPYTAETKQNQELSKLLFDSLIKLDAKYNAEYCIAKSAVVSGNTCTVELNSVRFSDGSTVSADDVVYSLKQAKEGSVYNSKLACITSYYAAGPSTVIIQSEYTNPYLVNLLDFPIIKTNTADRTDGNNRTVPPIGCGRYIWNNDKGYYLTANKSYYKGAVKLGRIELIDCPDDDSLNHYISMGAISAVYSDLSASNIPKKSGALIKCDLNNLVFLGVNCYSPLFSKTEARFAVSLGLDRKSICSGAFYDFAQPSNGLLLPSWKENPKSDTINEKQNISQSVAYLKSLGYNDTDSDGYHINSSGDRMSFSLLFNSDNASRESAALQIKSQLKKCGIEVKTVAMNYNDYLGAIASGKYDIYIGEVKITNDMYLGSILNPGVIAGFPSPSASTDAFNQYCAGQVDLSTCITTFAAELPFIPLCYRSGVIVCTNWLADHIKFSPSDIYNGIENYG